MIRRDKLPLTMISQVCSNHFQDEDMDLNYKHVINGEVVLIPRGRAASIKDDALPLRLDNYPPYYQPKIKQRKPPPKRTEYIPKKRKKAVNNGLPELQESENLENPVEVVPLENVVNLPTDDSTASSKSNQNPVDSTDPQPSSSTVWNHNKVNELSLPVGWLVCNTTETDRKIVIHVNPKNIQIDKSITFKGTSAPEIKFRGTVTFNGDISKGQVTNTKVAQKVLNSVHIMRVCQGTGIAEKPFSTHCNGPAVSKGKRCTFCAAERERQRKKESRKQITKERFDQKRAKNKNILQSLRRSKVRLLAKVKRYSRIYFKIPLLLHFKII